MNIVSELTVPEKILQAAYYLEEHGQSPFSAEALIVTSWQKYPKTFGLKGYDEQYPDSNKILSSIMGERGLARRGWLAKMGQKLYTLTCEGRQVVVRLHAGGETSEKLSQVKLTREHEKHLLNLLGSNAAQKFEEGLKEELTFADACGFWGITDSIRGDALTARLDRLRAVLAEAEKLVGTGTAELSTGRSVSRDELYLLTAVDEYLQARFARHLSLLQNRSMRN